MKKSRKLVIFGTGEIAQLARYYFMHDSPYLPVAFTADDAYVKTDEFDGLPLIPASELTKRYPTSDYDGHVALSYRRLNETRMQKFSMMKDLGYRLASYVCTRSVTWPDLTVGENCMILENQTIQPTVKIGDNVMIWSGNHLGHGCSIGNHTYISSHVCVSGHVKIGERCFLGVNACLKDFISVGDRSFITMGSSVVKDIPPDSVVLGAKNTFLEGSSELGSRIIQDYFYK